MNDSSRTNETKQVLSGGDCHKTCSVCVSEMGDPWPCSRAVRTSAEAVPAGDIVLPPLPKPGYGYYAAAQLQDYARAAIQADRARRAGNADAVPAADSREVLKLEMEIGQIGAALGFDPDGDFELEDIHAAIRALKGTPAAAVPEPWPHVTNEWADMAISGLQWVRNINEGISTPADAVASLESSLVHCRAVTDAAAVPAAQPVADATVLEEIDWDEAPLNRCPKCGQEPRREDYLRADSAEVFRISCECGNRTKEHFSMESAVCEWNAQPAAAVPAGAYSSGHKPRDPSKPAEAQGLFRKYHVTRLDGTDAPGEKHHGCDLFVLDLTHDQHARRAVVAYAMSCRDDHPYLSADLLAKWGAAPQAEQLSGNSGEVDADLPPLPLTAEYEPDCPYPAWVNDLLTEYATATLRAERRRNNGALQALSDIYGLVSRLPGGVPDNEYHIVTAAAAAIAAMGKGNAS